MALKVLNILIFISTSYILWQLLTHFALIFVFVFKLKIYPSTCSPSLRVLATRNVSAVEWLMRSQSCANRSFQLRHFNCWEIYHAPYDLVGVPEDNMKRDYSWKVKIVRSSHPVLSFCAVLCLPNKLTSQMTRNNNSNTKRTRFLWQRHASPLKACYTHISGDNMLPCEIQLKNRILVYICNIHLDLSVTRQVFLITISDLFDEFNSVFDYIGVAVPAKSG